MILSPADLRTDTVAAYKSCSKVEWKEPLYWNSIAWLLDSITGSGMKFPSGRVQENQCQSMSCVRMRGNPPMWGEGFREFRLHHRVCRNVSSAMAGWFNFI